MSEKVLSVMAAFDGAVTRSDLAAAKRRAARLSNFDQLCLVDTVIGATRRLRASGVL